MATLPTKRQFLTDLITSIPSLRDPTNPLLRNNNPFQALSSNANLKATFLTLHVLFPNELLPALDLLDRNLVMRMHLPTTTTATEPTSAASTSASTQQQQQTRIYHVRSQQNTARTHHRFGRHRDHNDTSTEADDVAAGVGSFYEVRPYAWNCSCPAFVFGAFPSGAESVGEDDDAMDWVSDGEGRDEGVRETTTGGGGQGGWRVGGLTRGRDAPVCKHLLACVLVEHCADLFGGFVQEREVCMEEIVGWAAGWGG